MKAKYQESGRVLEAFKGEEEEKENQREGRMWGD